MTPSGLLQQLVLVYALAVVLLMLTARLRVPSIVALIAAGVIAGPAGAGFVTAQHDVDLLAEIGVALLLFTAGLEFSLEDLRRMWRRVVPGGAAQVVFTVAGAGAVAAIAGGLELRRILVVGLFVALSSTAVVLKELSRSNQLHSPFGRMAVGVLLLQDFIVIGVLAAAPALLYGGGATRSDNPVAPAVLRLLVVSGGVLLLGRVVLPRLLRLAAALSRETFSLAVLLASVGTAWLAALLGLSMAAGAFLAGLVLAEGEFSHQVHADVRPLRDLLASLFFVSVGMLIDVSAILPVLWVVIAVAAAILVLKCGIAAAALTLTGTPLTVAVAAGIALAQVGEFSFVLGRAALEAGIISDTWWQILLAASVVTMAITPFLVEAAPRLATKLTPRGMPVSETLREEGAKLKDHVVILGYGIGGQLVARSLEELAVPYVVLELNGATVRQAVARGVNIYYADVSAPEPLEAAGVDHAAAVVALLSDPTASERAIKNIRAISASVPVIARSRYRLEAERLVGSGATLAVAEEMEASLEVLSQLMARLHVPGNVIETLVDNYRRVIGAGIGRTTRAPAIPLEQLPREIVDAPVSSFRLPPDAWAVGRTLQEADLRATTGSTVLAVRRSGQTTTSPHGAFQLEAGDDIFLMGDDSDITLARNLLGDGPRVGERTTVRQA